MRQTGTRQLFDYWNQLRGDAPAPLRADIAPHAIAPVLPHFFILNVDEDRPVFRLIGTWLGTALGADWTGRAFDRLFDASDSELVDQIVQAVAEQNQIAIFDTIAENRSGDTVALEGVVLPLADRPMRIIGAIHPATRPLWLGDRPIQPLRMTTVRLLDPMRPNYCLTNRPAVSLPHRPTATFGRRRSFGVIDGDRRLTVAGKRSITAPVLHVVDDVTPPADTR